MKSLMNAFNNAMNSKTAIVGAITLTLTVAALAIAEKHGDNPVSLHHEWVTSSGAQQRSNPKGANEIPINLSLN